MQSEQRARSLTFEQQPPKIKAKLPERGAITEAMVMALADLWTEKRCD
jgi:hypothetical protein